jgi:hypothetical protein
MLIQNSGNARGTATNANARITAMATPSCLIGNAAASAA